MTLLTGWPSLTDDSGDGASGTVLQKSVFDTMKSSIETVVHSTVNPGITPEDIIDEVVVARGNKANLNLRIAGVIDPDGALVTPATLVSQATLGATMGLTNYVRNGKFDNWDDQDIAPPEWVLSGAGATVAKTGQGLGDGTRKIGKFAAKISSVAADAVLTQTVIAAADWESYDFEETDSVVLGAYVWSADAGSVHVKIDDGNTTSSSTQHTGNSTWQLLTVVHTISAAATKLDIQLVTELTNNDGWFSGVFLVFSDVAPSRYIHAPYESDSLILDTSYGLRPRYDDRYRILEDDFISGGLVTGEIGELGWLLTQTGSGTLSIGGSAGHPGFISYTTAATTNDKGTLALLRFTIADVRRFVIVGRLAQTTLCRAFFGLSLDTDRADVQASSIEGLGYFYDSGVNTNWNATIDNTASAQETDDSGVAVVANEFVKFEFVKNSNNTWNFYLNDQLTHTSVLTIDAADGMEPKFGIETLTTAGKAVAVDYFAIEYKTSAPRFP